MTESLFLYSSANVYEMAENVYPINKKVTIDVVIMIFLCVISNQFIKYYMLGLFSDSDKTNFLLSFVM